MKISQFQKYSQRENVVTNNVLLMLSKLHDIKANYYKDLINRLNETEHYFPSPIFQQQVQVTGDKGIIDGHIELQASKIIIETKLSNTEFINKLIKYAKDFSKEGSNNFLWHISTEKYDNIEVEEILKILNEQYWQSNIIFKSLLFSDIIDNLEALANENQHDYNLKILFDDFNEYCHEENLITNYKYKFLFVPTGDSYEWNLEHKMYFCPTNWHKQKFTYFGLYFNKSIRTFATVENCIVADFEMKNKKLTIHNSSEGDVSKEQKDRLLVSLCDWGKNQKGLKYYLFKRDDFYKTNFIKISKGGIQGYRYKDLVIDIFKNKKKLDETSTEEIAELLKDQTWE